MLLNKDVLINGIKVLTMCRNCTCWISFSIVMLNREFQELGITSLPEDFLTGLPIIALYVLKGVYNWFAALTRLQNIHGQIL